MTHITPEIQTLIDTSIRKFTYDAGGNNRAWRRAVSALIKARSEAEREAEKRGQAILAGIRGTS